MALVASLAINPENIWSIFLTDKINKSGQYALWFYLDGQEKQIIVDDNVPVNILTKSPAFASPHNSKIWVCLLEKAWAKINGCYANIEGGRAREVSFFLNDHPIKIFKHEEVTWDEFWIELTRASWNKDSITVSNKKDMKGLNAPHIFSVM